MLNSSGLEGGFSFTIIGDQAKQFVLQTDPQKLYDHGVQYQGVGREITISAPLATLIELDILKFAFSVTLPDEPGQAWE